MIETRIARRNGGIVSQTLCSAGVVQYSAEDKLSGSDRVGYYKCSSSPVGTLSEVK